jgi:hypothetical protein
MATPPDRVGAPTEAPPHAVEIQVRITGGETDHMEIAVSPWEARVRPGAEVSWAVAEGVDSITITPKDASQWPFPGNQSQGRPGQPARAGRVRQDAPPHHRYGYNIRVVCGSRTIDIDPDIVIRDPMNR